MAVIKVSGLSADIQELLPRLERALSNPPLPVDLIVEPILKIGGAVEVLRAPIDQALRGSNLPPDDHRRLFLRGIQLAFFDAPFDRKQIRRAANLLAAAIGQVPRENASIRLEIAAMLACVGFYGGLKEVIDEALKISEREIQRLRSSGIKPPTRVLVRLKLSEAELMALVGQPERGLEILDRSYDLINERTDFWGAAKWVGQRGWLKMLCGEFVQASELFQRAADLRFEAELPHWVIDFTAPRTAAARIYAACKAAGTWEAPISGAVYEEDFDDPREQFQEEIVAAVGDMLPPTSAKCDDSDRAPLFPINLDAIMFHLLVLVANGYPTEKLAVLLNDVIATISSAKTDDEEISPEQAILSALKTSISVNIRNGAATILELKDAFHAADTLNDKARILHLFSTALYGTDIFPEASDGVAQYAAILRGRMVANKPFTDDDDLWATVGQTLRLYMPERNKVDCETEAMYPPNLVHALIILRSKDDFAAAWIQAAAREALNKGDRSRAAELLKCTIDDVETVLGALPELLPVEGPRIHVPMDTANKIPPNKLRTEIDRAVMRALDPFGSSHEVALLIDTSPSTVQRALRNTKSAKSKTE